MNDFAQEQTLNLWLNWDEKDEVYGGFKNSLLH